MALIVVPAGGGRNVREPGQVRKKAAVAGCNSGRRQSLKGNKK